MNTTLIARLRKQANMCASPTTWGEAADYIAELEAKLSAQTPDFETVLIIDGVTPEPDDFFYQCHIRGSKGWEYCTEAEYLEFNKQPLAKTRKLLIVEEKA